jgi:hypothetical protein
MSDNLRLALGGIKHTTIRGQYRVSAASGLLTGAAIVAGAPLFAARWGNAAKLAVITRIQALFSVISAFTAPQELGAEAVIARAFSVSDSAGTAIDLTGNNQKVRTSQDTSLFTDMRIAAATLLTAGTRVLDPVAIAGGEGVTHDPNAAAATAQVIATPKLGFDWQCDVAAGEHPVVLAQNEGLIIRNTIVFPAAGTARLRVLLAWAEIDA